MLQSQDGGCRDGGIRTRGMNKYLTGSGFLNADVWVWGCRCCSTASKHPINLSPPSCDEPDVNEPTLPLQSINRWLHTLTRTHIHAHTYTASSGWMHAVIWTRRLSPLSILGKLMQLFFFNAPDSVHAHTVWNMQTESWQVEGQRACGHRNELQHHKLKKKIHIWTVFAAFL